VRIGAVRTARQLKRWIRFPYSIYSADSAWVAPPERLLRLRLSKSNPIFEHCEAQPLLALDAQGRVRGRVLAHVNHQHLVQHGERVGFFGFFECEDDPAVARALLDAASEFAAERGCVALRGPFNMTAYQELGIVTEGFGQPMGLAETHTAEHYPALMEAAGMQPCKRISTFHNNNLAELQPDSWLEERHHKLIADPNFSVRTMDMRRYKHELVGFGDLLNDCFRRNWHYLPLSAREVQFEFGGLKQVIHPELVLVAEYHGLPVGFAIAMPDVNRLLRPMRGKMGPVKLVQLLRGMRRLRQACLTSIGVARQLRAAGVMRVMLHRMVKTLQRLGFESLSSTWVGDDNFGSLAQVRLLEMERKHRLSVYERGI
jgi:GNAT superfamily N-acetyltransferase